MATLAYRCIGQKSETDHAIVQRTAPERRVAPALPYDSYAFDLVTCTLPSRRSDDEARTYVWRAAVICRKWHIASAYCAPPPPRQGRFTVQGRAGAGYSRRRSRAVPTRVLPGRRRDGRRGPGSVNATRIQDGCRRSRLPGPAHARREGR